MAMRAVGFEQQRIDEFEAKMNIFAVPIRRDLSVKIYGLPRDLTKEEADKIARVILAYAVTST